LRGSAFEASLRTPNARGLVFSRTSISPFFLLTCLWITALAKAGEVDSVPKY